MHPKSESEIKALRESGRMLATVLEATCKQVKSGISTKELDQFAASELKKLGGKPAFLGFNGFPASICISINDEVVHGLPGKRTLKPGDLVGLDFGVKYKGMITDSARVVVADGKASKDVARLIETTQQALDAGIGAVKTGAHTGDIGAAVEAVLRSQNLGVVEDLVGHGVGHSVHEPPEVPNYGTAGTGPVLKRHMSIAIEPMANLGSKSVYLAADGWTYKTADGSISAQIEDTVLVTDKGAEVLTRL